MGKDYSESYLTERMQTWAVAIVVVLIISFIFAAGVRQCENDSALKAKCIEARGAWSDSKCLFYQEAPR